MFQGIESDSFPVAPVKDLTRGHCIKAGSPNFFVFLHPSQHAPQSSPWYYFFPSLLSPLNNKYIHLNDKCGIKWSLHGHYMFVISLVHACSVLPVNVGWCWMELLCSWTLILEWTCVAFLMTWPKKRVTQDLSPGDAKRNLTLFSNS